MDKLFHLLFLSCLKASELVEKRFHFALSFKEKIQLRVHMTMCKSCTQYSEQSKFIGEGISRIQEADASQQDIEALKKKISKSLSNSSKQ
ncbi:hypothetical protein [Saccharicrinis aurantiacus]|uniref:hypothetical protein n=1 Tax=Saccharicrinis aurantiacus TaxID=1849719 RepID=UPI00248FB6A3|nr:hypothetical protein [Saccharicrinis aurantiacus]